VTKKPQRSKRRLPKCVVCEGFNRRTGSDYCSERCELEALRAAVAEKDEKLARLSRKKGDIKSLVQVKWDTCIQEWYPRDTYDAKRRAHQLRGLGYTCIAKHIGQMPVDYGGRGMKLVHVTLLTAWHEKKAPAPPVTEIIEGLRFVSVKEAS
jgi:hypothetical protein